MHPNVGEQIRVDSLVDDGNGRILLRLVALGESTGGGATERAERKALK